MIQLNSTQYRLNKPIAYLLILTLLFFFSNLPPSLALPTWYDIGNYVIYDSQVDWVVTSTVSEANEHWHINMSLDPNYPVLVEPYYSNASLIIQMVQRIALSATWKVIEHHDILVVVRSYTHEVRTYSDTVEIARFEIKDAYWPHDVDSSYPNLFIGFDPIYLSSNQIFKIGDMEYENLGTEEIETPWGTRMAYHIFGRSIDPAQNKTCDKWCDVVSGIILKSDLRQNTGKFGNLQYYERYREILVLKETNIDITKFEIEPWYQFNLFGFRLWQILVVFSIAVSYIIVKRHRTKPIEF